ncbi:hypothetical protein LTR59_018195, partial [Friedmanniomyces endolithicus]
KGQQKKEQAKAAASDKKVNVAITKYDSIFKNISLPGGISTKATEYRELAAKGDRWESPVFSIGSGRESSRIASAGMPSRRNQGGNNRGVQGVQGLGGNTLGGGDFAGQRTDPRLGGMGGAATGGYGDASGGLGGPGSGYGNTGGGFANQVNDAFAGDKSQGLGLNGGAGASGLTGATGTGTGITGAGETGGTFLGRDNPVLRGQV